MGDGTHIEWSDATWNPLVGCSHVSPGCDNCYAAREASGRLAHLDAYKGIARGGRFTGRVRLLPDRLDQPKRWKRPRRIFVNSMADAFHQDVPFDYIARMWAVMFDAHWHRYQLLTKRPQRMAELVPDLYDLNQPAADLLAGTMPHPFPHVALGVSVENQRYADLRVRHLLATPAAMRFLSVEPMLGPIELDLEGIDWVIVGGESGPGARPVHPEWVRSLRDQCEGQGVPFFFKQWGEHVPAPVIEDPNMFGGRGIEDPKYGGRKALAIRERRSPTALSFRGGETRPMRPGDVTKGGVHMLDEQTVVVKVGKRRAGAELDGREIQEFPDGW